MVDGGSLKFLKVAYNHNEFWSVFKGQCYSPKRPIVSLLIHRSVTSILAM